jgi:hypothetical protein
MGTPTDNETWIIYAGDAVIKMKAVLGVSALSLIERLVYCVWVADYGMRNAGDLETAHDLYPNFQREAAYLAGEVGLGFTRESFLSPTTVIQDEYFERFDRICDEIKNAHFRIKSGGA